MYNKDMLSNYSSQTKWLSFGKWEFLSSTLNESISMMRAFPQGLQVERLVHSLTPAGQDEFPRSCKEVKLLGSGRVEWSGVEWSVYEEEELMHEWG